MNPKRIVDLLGRLAMLKYFPAGNDAVMEGLLCLVGDMCADESQVEWLVRRMTSGIYSEWPGPAEMRACFCSRFPPKDGVNAYSTVYLDGLPPSKESRLGIAGARLKGLPAGHTVSADQGVEDAVHIACQTKALTQNLGGPATEEEIRTAPEWLKRLEGFGA
jgi:hypothetical protein